MFPKLKNRQIIPLSVWRWMPQARDCAFFMLSLWRSGGPRLSLTLSRSLCNSPFLHSSFQSLCFCLSSAYFSPLSFFFFFTDALKWILVPFYKPCSPLPRVWRCRFKPLILSLSLFYQTLMSFTNQIDIAVLEVHIVGHACVLMSVRTMILHGTYAHSLHAGASVRARGDGEAETNRDKWHTPAASIKRDASVCAFALGCVFALIYLSVCACVRRVPTATVRPRSEAIAPPLAWRRLRQRVRLLPW